VAEAGRSSSSRGGGGGGVLVDRERREKFEDLKWPVTGCTNNGNKVE
jgi:hypothetical protein